MKNEVEIIKILLERDEIDINKNNPLYYASENGNLEIVDLFLDKKLQGEFLDLNQYANDYRGLGLRSTALFIACTRGHGRIVERLLEIEDLDVNKGYIYIPFWENAIKSERKLLLSPLAASCCSGLEKEDDETTIELYYVPLSFPFGLGGGNKEIVELLLQREEIDVNKGYCQPLSFAIMNQNDELIHILLDREDIDINCENSFYHPLPVACETKNRSVVDLLLERNDLDFNSPVTKISLKAYGIPYILEKLLNSGFPDFFDVEDDDDSENVRNFRRFIKDLIDEKYE